MRRTSITIKILLLLFNSYWLYANSGGNTCSEATANSVPLPFSSSNVSICDSQMSNSISNSTCGDASIHSRPDWLFHIKPQETGVVTVTIDNISKSGGSFVNLYMYAIQGCSSAGAAFCKDNTQVTSFSTEAVFSFEADKNEDYYILIEKTSGGNYASCLTFDIAAVVETFDPPALPSCSNADFESGSFADWQLTHGESTEGYQGDATPRYTTITMGRNPDVSDDGHIVHTGGTDEYGSFPRVYPDGGTYSVQIGNRNTGARAERIAQKFMVNASNASFTYHYAVVFEKPDHNTYEQPFFKARLRDQDGKTVACSEFVVAAASGLPGFQKSTKLSDTGEEIYYKTWSAVNVDLSNYIGQEIIAEFTVGDCTVGGHFGYAYVDASCSNSLLAENDQRTVCQGQSTVLQAPEGYQSYTWQKGASDEQAGQSFMVSPTVTTTYSLELTSHNGCKSVKTATVQVNDCSACTLSSPAPAVSSASCPDNANGSATINPSGGSGNYLYRWTDSNGQEVGTDATVTGLTAGATYTVTVTDGADATCSINKQVMVPPIDCPTPCTLSIDELQSTKVTCQPNPDGTTSASVSGGTGNYTYRWTDNAGNEVGNTETAINLPAGYYTLTLTDEQGCTDTGTVRIKSQSCSFCALSAQAVLEANNACGNTATITAKGGSGTYVFSSDVGTLSPNGNTATLTNLPSGTHTVRIADANEATCTTTAMIEVPTTAALALSTSAIASDCEQPIGSASVQVSGGQPPYQYNWMPSGGSEAVATGLAGGVYTVAVTDAAGCSASGGVAVEPVGAEAPSVLLGADTTICESSFLVLDASFPGASYQWQDGSSRATYLVNQAGTYTVTVSNVCGSQSTSIVVSMSPCEVPRNDPPKVLIANALTPNGDGQNDTFFVENIEDYAGNELVVYNRWGSIVYQAQGYRNKWGGTFKGRLLPTGAYYYILRLNNADKDTYSGSVSIFE